MGRFHDTINSWKDEDGATTIPEDWEAGLTGAYDDDFSEAGDISSAKISEMETANAALAAALQAAKAANWDLLQQIPTGEDTSDSDPDNSENDEDPESPSDDIDSLFQE